MNRLVILSVILIASFVNCEDAETKDMVEGRGKAKYALLTHLAIIFGAKVGLYKIVLGIALVVASIKAMVVMAWVLAAFKYIPDPWPYYRDQGLRPYNDKFYQPPVHFFYVVATKLFVLKIVYGIIFYVILTKAWHFVIWLIHYLKEKKHDHYVEFDHGEHYYDHHDHHHDYYDHQPYGKPSYGKSDNYKYKQQAIYDADGSYSVKKP
ncbi:hypothetical protein RR48_04983 [Papilio machaon]|uniref:Uncharacterized protein n=1 Tax=Papilio machaon TaxID=76193 RepID=A0A0N1INM1_PAPMA|nr:hypothetical protein RR48_04983 [Papilio machaon]